MVGDLDHARRACFHFSTGSLVGVILPGPNAAGCADNTLGGCGHAEFQRSLSGQADIPHPLRTAIGRHQQQLGFTRRALLRNPHGAAGSVASLGHQWRWLCCCLTECHFGQVFEGAITPIRSTAAQFRTCSADDCAQDLVCGCARTFVVARLYDCSLSSPGQANTCGEAREQKRRSGEAECPYTAHVACHPAYAHVATPCCKTPHLHQAAEPSVPD
ncbi:hypothetical protein [Sphingomonas sp.]|uniref:hypothetical protein n=1 Tax=Sphingomonas sp. TaxID=28214 RepID=UPI002DE88DC7|nr:hypothetical protein [Sphingomonas sp.]